MHWQGAVAKEKKKSREEREREGGEIEISGTGTKCGGDVKKRRGLLCMLRSAASFALRQSIFKMGKKISVKQRLVLKRKLKTKKTII